MSTVPWYQNFFGDDYIRIYLPFLPAHRTEQDVANILELLPLPPQSQILDLCCGQGRHAIPLARAGYQLTGLDLSQPLLELAIDEANRQDVEITWLQSDMREIPFEQTFDAVINIFTSFGYLENEEEDLHVLEQVAKSLKPAGLFLLETVYQPKVLRAFTPHSIIRYPDGMLVLEERQIDLRTSRNEVHLTLLYPDGSQGKQYQSMRIYTLTELTHMLEASGFEVQAYYGDLDRRPLSLDSRLVILSRRL
ncbi:MAG TPA: class I SAM-dependent methyltransferase [Ktedonobacteraceae bacterium]|jgi:SAM-dependent methyltransferase|nr:class I SAM-dependent methyltransferase [Ktedonobacteraceae bacterium]